ncbi:MAG: hypothetical protein ACLQBL_09440 [Polyangiaceae bacterium]
MNPPSEETERSVTEALMDLCEENETGQPVSFRDAGIMTMNEGFELHLPSGQTFQVTVVEGRRR